MFSTQIRREPRCQTGAKSDAAMGVLSVYVNASTDDALSLELPHHSAGGICKAEECGVGRSSLCMTITAGASVISSVGSAKPDAWMYGGD